jgi:hypothetical protein
VFGHELLAGLILIDIVLHVTLLTPIHVIRCDFVFLA